MINLQNLFLKLFNNDKYRNIKYLEKRKNNLDHYNSNIYKKILNNNKTIKNKKELNFVHSGHLGDIIYSLATIKKLSETHVCRHWAAATTGVQAMGFPRAGSGVFVVAALGFSRVGIGVFVVAAL